MQNVNHNTMLGTMISGFVVKELDRKQKCCHSGFTTGQQFEMSKYFKELKNPAYKITFPTPGPTGVNSQSWLAIDKTRHAD
jgi:hypothetical protein